MCGIAGIVSPKSSDITIERLRNMTDAIAHRGPQGDGFWIDSTTQLGFGHRRLAIIDLSDAGIQPMHYGGNLTIVFNGEIYNYRELKSELEKKSFQFQTSTDTEVILAAYQCYGENCLDYFDGMYAFAIWDSEKQSLFAARDRYGEKPFYYHYDGSFVFASEMKALWAAGVNRSVNHRMLLAYLSLGYVQNPADKFETFFEGISSLPPGYCLRVSANGKPVLKKYHSPEKLSAPDNISDAADRLFELLEISVNRRLRSDVPLGTSLSGGLDSTVIADLVAEKTPGKFRTFSAVFPGFEKDESSQIAETVAKYGLENFTVTPTADEMVNDFKRLCHHQEEPCPSSSIYTQFRVYELAKNHGVTVILDGQGADEILGGYARYIHWFLQELIARGDFRRFKKEKKIFAGHLQFDWSAKNYLAAFMPSLAAEQLTKRTIRSVLKNEHLSAEYRESYFEAGRFAKPEIRSVNEMLAYNTGTLGLEELLRYADRNSMAHSREVRLPFLNNKLVEFANSLPAAMKFKNGYGKYVLRQAMQQRLTPSIAWRPGKTGFEPPQKQWFTDPRLREFANASREKLVNRHILSKQVLHKKIQPHEAHAADNYDWRYLVAGAIL